jgi:hypothetical protein
LAATTGVAAILRKPYTVDEVLSVTAQVLAEAGESRNGAVQSPTSDVNCRHR